ncbi:MAG: HNH endonuclease, partial [bacterium]
ACSSLFTYCTQVLHLSEHATYHRIEAARAARQFPVILELVAEGALTLTTVALLRPHLTRENCGPLLEAARCKSKREVEYQVACLSPRPEVRDLVRKLAAAGQSASAERFNEPSSVSSAVLPSVEEAESRVFIKSPRPAVAPLSPDRYLLKLTVSAETHSKLRRAQDLLRHTIPNGDPAAVLDRALTLLVEQLERTKIARTNRPRPASRTTTSSASSRQTPSRHIPALMRRAVWSRDQGRCAFVGPNGRCVETGRLEFHHAIPFADGGPTTIENLGLRCRAHNGFESERWFGTGTAEMDQRG